MGINFKGSNAEWSYCGFQDFRKRLAACVGIDLDRMDGFHGDGSWEGIQDDIVPFLNHSDRGGESTPDECKRMAPRLRELVKDWPDGHDRRNALILADDMERMSEVGVNLVWW